MQTVVTLGMLTNHTHQLTPVEVVMLKSLFCSYTLRPFKFQHYLHGMNISKYSLAAGPQFSVLFTSRLQTYRQQIMGLLAVLYKYLWPWNRLMIDELAEGHCRLGRPFLFGWSTYDTARSSE